VGRGLSLFLGTWVLVHFVFVDFAFAHGVGGFDELFYTPTKRYADVIKTLEGLEKSFPDQVELFDLGANDAGQMIKGIKVGKGGLQNLVVGTHHGNEYGATEVAEAFAKDIAAKPISGQTLYVIPVLNIPGYDSRNRREVVGRRSFDPNRDYPGPCGTDGPFNLKSTKALADFLEKTPIVTSATLHTYWPAVLYPWGISTKEVDTRYTDVFLQIGAAAVFASGYKVANSTLELYPADGTFEDYAFWRYGIWSMLFEMGNSHTPSNAEIEKMVAGNVPGLRKMFENSPTVRAPEHQFEGKCSSAMKLLRRRNE
jgi:carboxypeptidase T